MKIKVVLEETDNLLGEIPIKAVLIDGKRFVPEIPTMLDSQIAVIDEVRPIYTEHQSRIGIYFKLPAPIKFKPGQKVRITEA